MYLRFRASLIYINNCPTRCNTKQSIYYSASSLYMFRVSTTPIMSTQNCNYSLRYCAATSLQRDQALVYQFQIWLERYQHFKIQYISNCPTRCNTKQSICYSASSLCMFRVSTTPIIRSTQNCNYSLRYWAVTSLQRGRLVTL